MASTLLPKVLEISLCIFLLLVLLGVSLAANYKQWKVARETETAHNAALAALNAARLEDAKTYATGREESSTQLRAMADKFGGLLDSIEKRGRTDEKNEKLQKLIAAKLEIPLENYL